MNKKLPKLYHGESIVSNNKKTYYSANESERKVLKNDNIKEVVKSTKKYDSFVTYFNKNVLILLKNGTTIKGKILSKIDNTILVTGGVYLDIDDIDSIT